MYNLFYNDFKQTDFIFMILINWTIIIIFVI